MTQPVKIGQFQDEFGYDRGGNKKPNTPAKPDSVLALEAKDGELATAEEHARYQSVAGITNHMAQWTRIDVQNVQRSMSISRQANEIISRIPRSTYQLPSVH